MINRRPICFGVIAALTASHVAFAGSYNITDQEREACQADAVALCSATFPDQDRLVACMRHNEGRLSVNCHTVLVEGLRRRHLL